MRYLAVLTILGGVGCASRAPMYDVKPVGDAQRYAEGRALHERRSGGIRVTFAADTMSELPFCVAARVRNETQGEVRVDPDQFFVQDLKDSVDGYQADVAQRHEASPPREPPSYEAAKLIEPEAALREAKLEGRDAARGTRNRSRWADVMWAIGATDSQLGLSRASSDRADDARTLQKRVDSIENQWLRKTDLAPGQQVSGLVCMTFDEEYAKGLILTLPVGSEKISMAYRFAHVEGD
ncbi:MAG: hypothetical protein AAF735_06755 [Myxococcota bacterium]